MVERGEVSRSAGSASTRVTLELSDDVVGSDPLGVRVATASKSAENVGQAVILIP